MELETQVVSLELAKQLKEAGYPQEGLFGWKLVKDYYKLEYLKTNCQCYSFYYIFNPNEDIIAPTIAELGEKIGVRVSNMYTIFRENKEFFICNDLEEVEYSAIDYTEADARAKYWLELKRVNLI